jgi:hypothetical protein
MLLSRLKEGRKNELFNRLFLFSLIPLPREKRFLYRRIPSYPVRASSQEMNKLSPSH